MKSHKFIFVALCLLICSPVAFSQVKPKTPATVNAQNSKTSPAYAEVLLRKTELLSELESLLVEYTEEYPKVKDLRYESGLLQKEMDRMSAVDANRLSSALGRLMVRKCELETDLWNLQKQFNDQHTDVKQVRRKVEIFEAAISDILQNK